MNLSEKPLSFYSSKAKDLADQIDAALSLVPQSADGVDLAAADMLFLGPELSDLLREIAAVNRSSPGESNMNKLLEGLKEAVEVAKCDHDLVVQPRLTAKPALERFYCTKCQATIYEPIPAWRT